MMGRGGAAAVFVMAAAAACSGRHTGAVAGGTPGTLVDVTCEGDVPSESRCVTLSVYENRTTRTGRTIPLWILILPASGSPRAADPVFYLAGGPGQAAGDQPGRTRDPPPWVSPRPAESEIGRAHG